MKYLKKIKDITTKDWVKMDRVKNELEMVQSAAENICVWEWKISEWRNFYYKLGYHHQITVTAKKKAPR